MDKEKVILRLKDFGYEYDDAKDSASLDFAISKTSWSILNATNCADIPEGLTFVAMDMVCAEFLKIKKSFGQLTEIVFENVAKSISMGDTSITFAEEASPEQKFDVVVDYLLTGHEDEFLAYRKLVW